MILVRARFPFEVDIELGKSDILFPSKTIAARESRAMVAGMAKNGDISVWHSMQDRRPLGDGEFIGLIRVEFDRVELTKLTKEAMCEILNRDGEGSEHDVTDMGHIEIRVKVTPDQYWVGGREDIPEDDDETED